MKKLFFSMILMIGFVSFSTTAQAQTAKCTPAQIEACKKICGEAAAAKCTPAQKAACQKVCAKSSQANTSAEATLVSNLMETVTGTKTTKKACVKKTTAGCAAKKSSVVSAEKKSSAPVAQKVAQKTDGSEE